MTESLALGGRRGPPAIISVNYHVEHLVHALIWSPHILAQSPGHG